MRGASQTIVSCDWLKLSLAPKFSRNFIYKGVFNLYNLVPYLDSHIYTDNHLDIKDYILVKKDNSIAKAYPGFPNGLSVHVYKH